MTGTPVPERTSIAVEYPAVGPPAREHLRVLASRVTNVPADSRAGTYSYIRLRRWSAAPDGSQMVVEERRWRASDGSGRVTTIAAGQPDRSIDYPPGGLSGLPDPLPADAALLAGVIDSLYPWRQRPAPGLRGVNAVNGWHYLNHEHRVAALTVLLNVTPLRWRRRTVDPAGRPGVAVSYDTNRTRELLIFDEHTGELLAYARTTIPAASPSPAGPAAAAMTVVSSEVYLDRGRVAHPG